MITINARMSSVSSQAGLWVFGLLLSNALLAEEKYNSSFVQGDEAAELLNLLASGNDILPGTYNFDIFLNSQRVDQRDLKFERRSSDSLVAPCLTIGDYRDYGVKLPESSNASGCFDLVGALDGVKLNVDAGMYRLDLDVPQIYLDPRPNGAISPKLYDYGVTAGYINYNFNATQSRYSDKSANSEANYYFSSVNSGFNFGSWRIRDNSTVDKQNQSDTRWQNIATWAETDIVPWRSRLLVGDGSTGSSIFDSVSFRGVQLSSSSEMLPESLRGYAPVIRGVAASNARVEIRQNGYTIYSTNVPPGPFALGDIYPSNLSGNLDVSVIEADGTKKNFVVPFSSVPNMLREGILDYQLTAGKYRDGFSNYKPLFMQMGVAQGMGRDVTPYGGLLVAENYRSGVIGVGKNMGLWGAVSLDASYSDTRLVSGESKQGESLRFLYSKSLNSLGTEFRLAGYRYSTAGYYDFSDAIAERDRWEDGLYRNDYIDENDGYEGIPDWTESRRRTYYTSTFNNKRQRLDLSINQRFGSRSSFYLNATNQSYWGESGSDRTIQIGLNSGYNNINYGVYAQDSRGRGHDDRSVNVSVSIPFGSTSSYLNSNSNISHSSQGGSTYSSGVSGTLLDDNRMNYGAQLGRSDLGGTNRSVNAGYQGTKGNIDASYSDSDNYRQTSLGLSGGVVAHGGGVTFSQPLSNTFVLVEADKAQGVRLENQTGVAVDSSGYAVMTSVTPYRHNRVALRTEDIKAGLDVPTPVRDVVPTHGAIVKVKFDTHSGQNLLIHSTFPNGTVPPIGASVFAADGRSRGVVGTNGETYVSGINEGDRLVVSWGANEHDSCSLHVPKVNVNSVIPQQGYQIISLVCQLP